MAINTSTETLLGWAKNNIELGQDRERDVDTQVGIGYALIAIAQELKKANDIKMLELGIGSKDLGE